MFKTHVDAFDVWDTVVAQQLQQLADKHCEQPPSAIEYKMGRVHHSWLFSMMSRHEEMAQVQDICDEIADGLSRSCQRSAVSASSS